MHVTLMTHANPVPTGPVISSIAGSSEDHVVSLSSSDLDDDNKIAITFKVTDRDSAANKIELAAAVEKGKSKFVTSAKMLDPDGEM